MGLISCLESSVRNYQYSLHNNPKAHFFFSVSSFTTATDGTQTFMNPSNLLERWASLFMQLLGAIRILILSHCLLIKWVNSSPITLLFLLPHRPLSFANPVPTNVIYSARLWKQQSSNKKQTQ